MTAASLTRLQTFFGGLSPEMLLRVMIREEFPGKVAVFSSFGADSALLLAMVAEVDASTPVLFLDTGKHFQATLDYVESLKKLLDLSNVRVLRPDEEMLGRIDPSGTLWKSQPNRCCWLRKVEPLNRTLEQGEFDAVITGRKGYQTQERSELDAIELYEDGIFRINPFYQVSRAEFKGMFAQHRLPQHPLVAEGYLSIGCEPCTRQVKPGEDERSGRWAHTMDADGKQKQECGIHIEESSDLDWNV